MFRQILGPSLLALLAAGCSASNGAPAASARGASESPPNGALPGNPRYFQLLPDDTFWVTHDASRDRVISSGARLELTPQGEVVAASWETDNAHNGDLLMGGLALPPHLGGGYVFWSQSRLFRATEYTGPLAPISLGVSDTAETQIRGVRSGLRGAVVATDSGVRELLAGATAATAFPDPGVTDLAALDASRAVRIDTFGRAAWTKDAGKTWSDAPQLSSLGLRGLAASQDEVWFETWQGRAILGKEGDLTEPEQGYRYNDYGRPFQMAYRGTRADRDDGYWWGYREAQPVQAAVMSGVRFPDGSALGVVRGGVTRVDLGSGKILSIATDWLPNGVECQPHQMGDSVLFACAWDDYQGGSYLLRADGFEPPHVERFFSDDGAFVADDDGAFGYTGKCKAEARFVDPDRYYGRYGRRYYDGDEGQDTSVQPVFCVRRGPEDWVERKLELDQDTSLVAWIPRKDGTAVALVRGTGRGEALPDLARDSQRETSQNGVRVVRMYRDVDGWFWPAQQVRSYYSRSGNQQTIIDRRYRALDDGTIVAWVTDSESSYGQPPRSAGALLRPGERAQVFELPATPIAMATGGPFGVLTTRDGKVFESTDRGRTWRSAGVSALMPSTMMGTCSVLGCSFTTGVRVGWGTPSIAPRVIDQKRDDPPKDKLALPALSCEPQGIPRAEQSNTSPAAAQLGSQAKVILTTAFGATLEMIRETPDALSSASPYGYPRYVPPPVATATPSATPSAAPSSKAKAKAAPVRTHTLVFRPPLDPLAPIVRHNATNAAISSSYRARASAIPLLGAGNDISFLFVADQNEVLVDRTDIITVPQFDSRRYYYYGDASGTMPGLRTASNRALVFGDIRRRSSLEEHGALPQRPPYYFGFDRDSNRRRTLTLGQSEGGSVGVLVLDSAAPEAAGVAPYDRVASTFGALDKLAPWSTVVPADDAACRADRKGYRTLVIIDPSAWLTLDASKLPGVTLGKQGLALVRWSAERVCLEAIDVAVIDARRRGDTSAGESLVIRWPTAPAGKAPSKEEPSSEVTGALRSLELMQPLTCSMKRAQ